MQIITNQFQKELKSMAVIIFRFLSVTRGFLNMNPILLCGITTRR